MRRIAIWLAAGLLAVLAGCATPDRYPVTGAECAPGDPVQDLAVPECPPG